MFCVECGKETSIFKDGVCKDCYVKTHSFTEGPKLVDLPVCTNCDSYKYKNTWTNDIFDDTIRRIIKQFFQISNELKKVDITTECKEKKDEKICRVIISGFIDDLEISEEHNLVVRMKKTVCDVCSKRFGGYHEAIVQIRTDKKQLTKDEIINIRTNVENLVESLKSKGNRGLFITDIGMEHSGLDFYLSEKGAAFTVAKHIQEQYGGQIKQSSKNIGMKDSKQIYRMTYLVRLPSYKEGDFISLNNMFYYISSIYGNKIVMVELSNWKETTVDQKDLQKVNILGGKELIKEMIIVSQSSNEIQVMDPEKYNIKVVKKPKSVNFESEKIKVVIIEENYFLLPEIKS
jgi:nonsense-mediated mRNA decay protein 3